MLFRSAEADCNAVCGGPGIFGDVFSDGTLDSVDIETYMDIIQANLGSSTCYDLNANGELSVMDAALVNWCMHGNNSHPGGSFHNHCHFPRSITNPSDSIGLSISNINFTDNYLDIAVKNPSASLSAYQFTMNGINISSVVSLANPVLFPVDVRFIPNSHQVYGISIVDSSLTRSLTAQSLVRIYFNSITDTAICINSVTDLVNQNAEQTMKYLYDNCRTSILTSVTSVLKPAGIFVMPNPVAEKTFLHMPENMTNEKEILVSDVGGRTVLIPVQNLHDSWYEMNLSQLSGGVYFITIKNASEFGVARFVKL